MWHVLTLLLPALIPSWRFFQTVEASPCVQWTVDPAGSDVNWQGFDLRPDRITPWGMLVGLFWNPERNEALFLVTCAERIAEAPTDHALGELRHRVRAGLIRHGIAAAGLHALRFRLVFVERQGTDLIEQVVFESDPER